MEEQADNAKPATYFGNRSHGSGPSDPRAYDVKLNTYETEMEATVRVLHEIDPALVSRSKHVKLGLELLRSSVD